MKIKIYNQDGKPKGDQEFNLRSDFKDVSPQVVHDVITAYRAAQRSGTANTKTVAEVHGSGKKPWRQKGTGRARAGQARSPVWRKGGVVFGPRPRDYTKDIPRRVRKLAFEQALSTRVQEGDVVIVDSLDVASGKTRDFISLLAGLKVEGKTLLITEKTSEKLRRASRNIEWVITAPVDEVNTYQILNCQKLVLTRVAMETLTARNAEVES